MQLNIVARRPLRLFLSILVVLVVIGGVVWWMMVPSLNDVEKVALDYVYYAYVNHNANETKKFMSKDNQDTNPLDLGNVVKEGDVHIGERQDGDHTLVVVFFDDPGMSRLGSRLELEMVQENGQWKVKRDDFRGTSMTFTLFQQDDAYRKVGITEWKEAKLPE